MNGRFPVVAVIVVAVAALGVLWLRSGGDPARSAANETVADVNRSADRGETRGGAGGSGHTAPAGPSLHGRVVMQATGEPAPGVEVEAVRRGGAPATTRSDGQGRFALKGLAPNARYLLRAADPARDLVSVDARYVIAARESLKEGVTLSLAPGGSVSGKALIGDRGQPLEAATLACRRLDGDLAGTEWGDARSDGTGAYALPCLCPGQYRISCSPPANRTVESDALTRDVTVEAGGVLDGVDFVFQAGAAMAGQVVSTGGEPLAKAQVRVRRGHLDRTVETDADGRFAVGGLLPGTEYEVTASATGYAIQGVEMAVPAEGVDDVLFRLEKGAAVSGKVVNEKRQPMPNLRLRLNADDGEKNWYITRSTARTGSGGEFGFEGIPAGSYYFSVEFLPTESSPRSADNSPLADAGFTVSAGQRLTGLELVLRVLGQFIEGSVVNENGEPVADVKIQAWKADGAEDYANTRTDAKGAFRLEGFQSDLMEVGFEHPDYPYWKLRCPAGTSGLRVVLPSSGAVAGMVWDAVTGQPVKARVEVQSMLLDTGASTPPLREGRVIAAEADAQGNYRLDHLPPGTATVRALAEGYVTENAQEIPVEAGAQTEPVDFALRGSGRVEGQVALGPLAGREKILVHVTAVNPEAGEERSGAQADDAGRYSMELRAGLNVLTAFATVPAGTGHSLQLRQEAEVYVGSGETVRQDFAFDAGGTVRGYISLHEGEKRFAACLIDGAVEVPKDDGAILGQALLSYRESINPTGRFELPGVPPGRYNLIALADGGAGASVRRVVRAVTVKSGEVVDVSLDN